MALPQDRLTAKGCYKFAAIINDLTADESLFYDAAQLLTRIRRKLVAMLEYAGVDSKLGVWIPDHNICIGAGLDSAF